MNLNPFGRRRSLTPRGDPLLQRVDPPDPSENTADPPSTGTNYPVLGVVGVMRKGADIIARGWRSASSEPPAPQLTSPEDPSAVRLAPGNVQVIATSAPPLLPVPKPPEERCGLCHHPVGHHPDCPTWGMLFQIGDWPNDF